MKKYFQIATIVFVMFAISGCDLVKGNLDSALQSKSPQQISKEAEQAIADRNPQKAIEITKPFVNKSESGNEQIIYLAAKAHSEIGDVTEAISLLEKLVSRRYIEKSLLISDDAFASIRTDIRFISWMANLPSTNLNHKEPSAIADFGSPASVEIGTAGVSARAGNVSVKISN